VTDARLAWWVAFLAVLVVVGLVAVVPRAL